MDKRDLIRVVVGIIVLAFLLEVFSISGAQNYVSGPDEQPTPEPTAATGVFGTAEANATVLAYPDNIIVVSGAGSGTNANLSARLADLQRGGAVSYYNSLDAGSVNVILQQGANITAVAENLTLDFPDYALLAKAQVSLPGNLTFRGVRNATMNATVSARPYVQMEPFIEVGETVDVVVGATVESGRATGVEVQAAQRRLMASIDAQVVELGTEWAIGAAYNWEARPLNVSALENALKSRYPNSTFTFESNNYAMVANATAQEFELIKNLSYVTIATQGAVLFEDGFANRSRVEGDLFAIAPNATVSFPQTTLFVNVTSQELDEGFVRNATGAGDLTIVRRGTVEVGRFVQIGDRQYIAPPNARLSGALPANATIGGTVPFFVTVQVIGARIVSME